MWVFFLWKKKKYKYTNYDPICTLHFPSTQLQRKPVAVAAYFSQESIPPLCEMSDSARRVLSVAFASQCSDLTSPLSLPSCIQNQTLKRCSFLTRSLKKWKERKRKCGNMNHRIDLVSKFLWHVWSYLFAMGVYEETPLRRFLASSLPLSTQCHFRFHGQIVQAATPPDIWKVKRRSYSASPSYKSLHCSVL